MSELNLIKTVLFNASNLEEALTKLIELGFTYHEPTINKCFVVKVDCHYIEFWPVTDNKYALAVIINDDFQYYDDRLSFIARQLSAEQLVTAENSPELVGERPICPKCLSSEFVSELAFFGDDKDELIFQASCNPCCTFWDTTNERYSSRFNWLPEHLWCMA
ncbi:hypothetical protein [Rheinheimera sp. MMS21-TC3]|uniref:hypothetical protein n=1 Tax=Rheinheimera sp. MMS21-TC3 TaxID=3072790 RepID=UPI0028C4E376|nr:hypothetical protein [Rheinheimera sp. MMS21-TC3]WNO61085.1 hypothetical protein RDV63_09015 [Rheinheimera sp. MMS21-TC3]